MTSEFIATLILILLGLLWLYSWYKDKKYYKNIPIPPKRFFFGNALDINTTSTVIPSFMKYIETYGGLVKVQVGPFNRFLLVADYKMIEFLLTNTKFLEKPQGYKFLNCWLGTGLLVGHGPKWKRHRKILTPAFHFQILENSVTIFESCSDILIRKLLQKLDETSTDIYPFITLCSLDVICETIMGTSINAQEDIDSQYVHYVKEMCRIIMERSISPLEMNDFFYKFTKNYQIQKKAVKYLHAKANSVIAQRAKELEQKSGNSNKKKTFLDLLLETRIDGQPISKNDIREEVDTFMFAGHDTTSAAISFTLFCLAKYPKIQQLVYEEQQFIFENIQNPDVTYSDLQQMKYLELVIKETMRLYPSVPIIGRKTHETLYYDNFCIPKEETILIFIYGIHRNSNFFNNPEEFDPSRFENLDGKSPYAYIPFSAGPRNCIGQKFAMLEMKSIISKVIRKFELLPSQPEHNLELVAETVLKSKNGIKVGLKLRL